ncbi:hypothetical protein MAPG_02309 [Magnaporthiopsis poae ATCC 64411]|uniref:Uncharacterized protein n=1 Tax=Magnaporthiopsis poae (strain ATCC 64411 / 73-15) TaxID=644358 RepID=A0A0C4DR10_MAGP6|nr:hypothetical protein MAPG_02309 [Magnaporthiopsis poae ATCC 64411]
MLDEPPGGEGTQNIEFAQGTTVAARQASPPDSGKETAYSGCRARPGPASRHSSSSSPARSAPADAARTLKPATFGLYKDAKGAVDITQS